MPSRVWAWAAAAATVALLVWAVVEFERAWFISAYATETGADRCTQLPALLLVVAAALAVIAAWSRGYAPLVCAIVATVLALAAGLGAVIGLILTSMIHDWQTLPAQSNFFAGVIGALVTGGCLIGITALRRPRASAHPPAPPSIALQQPSSPATGGPESDLGGIFTRRDPYR